MEQIGNLLAFKKIFNMIFHIINLTKTLNITSKYRHKDILKEGGSHLKPLGLQRQLSREEQKSLNCAIANGLLMQK
jgi:hypothetical protein